MINTEIIKIFDSISPSLENFAEKYNLRIDKYWHEWSSWTFSFKNPKRGISSVEVMLVAGDEFEVNGYWWVDDYDNGIRLSKGYNSGFIKSNQITNALEQTLSIILNWELNSLTDIAEGLKETWHRYSKEEFYKLNDKYPVISFNS
jgi:hypothetical protein